MIITVQYAGPEAEANCSAIGRSGTGWAGCFCVEGGDSSTVGGAEETGVSGVMVFSAEVSERFHIVVVIYYQ